MDNPYVSVGIGFILFVFGSAAVLFTDADVVGVIMMWAGWLMYLFLAATLLEILTEGDDDGEV